MKFRMFALVLAGASFGTSQGGKAVPDEFITNEEVARRILVHAMKTLILLLALVFSLPVWATVNVQSYGAVGDGVTDNLTALNNAFSAGCTDGTIYFPKGTYLVSAPPNALNCAVTIYGDGSTSSQIKLGGPGSSNYAAILSFFSVSGTVTIHDIGLNGNSVHAVGIQLASVTTGNIYNCIVKNFGTPGYSTGNTIAEDGIYVNYVNSLTVQGCVISGNERSGLELIPASNATVSNNIFNGNGYYASASETQSGATSGPLTTYYLNNIVTNNGSGGFDVENNTGLTTSYGKISGNDIEHNGNDMWTYGYAAVIGNNAYGEMSNNIIIDWNNTGPTFSGYGTGMAAEPPSRHNITITNNYVSYTSANGILVNASGGGGAITGNFTFNNPTDGIYVYDTSATITGNYSYSNAAAAYSLNLCPGATTSNSSSAASDTTPPSVPTGLTATAASFDQINVSWTASTDNVAVQGYYVYRNGTQIAKTAGTQYPDTGLKQGTAYMYTVTAFDENGNLSSQSSGVFATTLGVGPHAGILYANGVIRH